MKIDVGNVNGEIKKSISKTIYYKITSDCVESGGEWLKVAQ